ncbi:Shedu anti-phage system protein SduA domain-containing protein [Streptomyces sp. NPDC088131]|uniref:Shedu anti-phage system protein SduA domain-containing protein n=1 Tax=Streptomyces sp. NPDC088131 TaxID=3365826 RepID=UPI0038072814
MTDPQLPARPQRTVATDRNPARPHPLAWKTYSDMALSVWYSLLSKEPEEEEVQRFLELHPAMIPGGSGDIGPGGHHGSDMGAVFRRPRLIGSGRMFEPDFMWITRSSGLVTPILIEIEKPAKRWFKKDGRPTSDFTEARDQLNDWRSWFARDSNQSMFRETFLFLNDKYKNRPLEPQYVLIYGRESEFDRGNGHTHPDELRYKRDQQRAKDETFMTFDSLRPRYDHGNSLTLTMTSHGPKIHAFSPTYGTSSFIGEGALILDDPQPALSRSVMMSDERRAYLAKRWNFWKEEERRINANPNTMFFRDSGIE